MAWISYPSRANQQQHREPQVMDTCGAALLATNDTTAARELLSAALTYSQGDPGIALNLARTMVAAGDWELARRRARTGSESR